SPTVLVNGRDVVAVGNELTASGANACRVYFDGCSCICAPPPAPVIERDSRGVEGMTENAGEGPDATNRGLA
ncbi:MAG TPA: hypothetical protein VJO33_13225, partial [Gemmatimonadaceae bacterium]|nr:hypothetical protein [Gemmatimonadaceae bacterium]